MAVESVPRELHRLSSEEYRRLVESGVFEEDARVELIDGLLADMSPKTRAHEQAISWLLEQIMTAGIDVGRLEVRISAPLTVGASEPEPDVAIVDRSAPRPNHPATAALVIEVAVSSQVRDLQEKPRVYAQAGVRRYWVVDLDNRRAVAHRDPHVDAYTRIEQVEPDGQLFADDLGLPPFSLAELFAAADR